MTKQGKRYKVREIKSDVRLIDTSCVSLLPCPVYLHLYQSKEHILKNNMVTEMNFNLTNAVN